MVEKEPLQVWEDKFKAITDNFTDRLNASIERIRVKATPDEDESDVYFKNRASWVAQIAKEHEAATSSLKGFATDHFNFFLNGFQSSVALKRKEDDVEPTRIHLISDPARGYTADFALNIVIKRVMRDYLIWTALLNVFEELLNQDITEGSEEKIGYKWTFLIIRNANLLANDILNIVGESPKKGNVKPLKYEEPASAMSFLLHVPVVRVYPYISSALITIPATATGAKRDYLAIPHELGHFLYWRAKTSIPDGDSEVDKYIHQIDNSKLPNILKPWIEEIFADIFGVLIGGSLYALSLQDQIKYNYRDTFLSSNDKHPIPALRPAILYCAIKHFFDKESVSWKYADILSEHWIHYLEERGITENFPISYNHESNTITLVEFEKLLDREFKNPIGIFKVLQKICKYLHHEEGLGEKLGLWMPNISDIELKAQTEISCTDPKDILENLYKEWECEDGKMDILIKQHLLCNRAGMSHLPDLDLSDLLESLLALLKMQNKGKAWEEWMRAHGFLPSEKELMELINGDDPESLRDEVELNSNKENVVELNFHPRRWLKILDAGDWTVEGPHGLSEDDGPP